MCIRDRLHLGPGVSNSVTRDAAVTASAALALQVESEGRAVLGIGRGDSSVQRIGKREDPVASFERYLAAVQAYLRGEPVDRDGFASRLEWMAYTKVPKVPVVVAATGPRVIEAAARHADAICLAVGADPTHVGAMMAHAREAARRAGRSIRLGAFVNAVVNDDARVARDAARGSAATFARFSAFRGSVLDRLPGPLAAAARYLREHYDMREHTRQDADEQGLRHAGHPFDQGVVSGEHSDERMVDHRFVTYNHLANFDTRAVEDIFNLFGWGHAWGVVGKLCSSAFSRWCGKWPRGRLAYAPHPRP